MLRSCLSLILLVDLGCAHPSASPRDRRECGDRAAAIRAAASATTLAVRGTGVSAHVNEGSLVEDSTRWRLVVAFEHGVVPTLAFLSVRKTDCAAEWELAAREE